VDLIVTAASLLALAAAIVGGRVVRAAAVGALAVLGVVAWRAIDQPHGNTVVANGLVLAAAALVVIAAGGVVTPARPLRG
jgi:hypothetical protein